MSTATGQPLSDVAQCAKDLVSELRRNFPASVKFSGKSKSYSGGNSVNISWEMGPTTKQVERYANKYQQGDFDGMTDCYNYRRDHRTQYSAKYVFCNRHIPTPIFEQMCRDYAALLGQPMPEGAESWNYRIEQQGENITSLVNRLLSVFDLTQGYHGIEHAKDEHGNEKLGAGFLEDFYSMIGGTRQERY
jgi:hypothetical protein